MNILYLHGMGGGNTSRVPNRLRQELSKMQFTKNGEPIEFNVICETYDFDPEVATGQIAQWVETYQPGLVISESMGAIYALGIHGMPHIYISPALNFDHAATVARPISAICNALGIDIAPKPRGPKRQKMLSDPAILARFKPVVQANKAPYLDRSIVPDPSFAFFGKNDVYMPWGIVSIKEYERLCGNSYRVHDGGHIFGVKYIKPWLIPKIIEMLGLEVIKPPRSRRKKQA